MFPTFLLAGMLSAVAPADEAVGRRPYEMVWANRTEDAREPLVDFEDLQGWTVECHEAAAELTPSRQQQLWGRYVGKLTYRGQGARPVVVIRPPKPVPLPASFDCLNLWLYGNNWGWAPDPTTPQVGVQILLRSRDGRVVRVALGRVRWKEWFLMHRRLAPEQLAALKDGAGLEGIEITGGRNPDDRTVYLDNLAVYQEPLPPLQFAPRPQRGVDPFPGQTAATNTGGGRLPFPTREQTILPDNLTAEYQVGLQKDGDAFLFHYRGADGHLAYRYRPDTGTLADVTVEWEGSIGRFRPMAEGGLYFCADNQTGYLAPEDAKLLRCERLGDTVVSSWHYTWGNRTAEATYTFRLWQKSLVVDVKCIGGEVGEFRVGRAVGVDHPRLVTLPYLTCDAQRPAVLVAGAADKPLFVSALLDYYRSNASSLWAVNRVAEAGVAYNGGSRYLPKTDGRRNDCFERLFLTVSPRFEEVLPNVPNPKSPWMHVAGERLWRAHGASNRQSDYAHWKKVARYGMTQVVITDHETGWRDGGESFTLRTRAAPGKGGDQGQAEYARKIRALGFRYGIYNNYTDYAPVNEHWDEDYVTRLSNGDWRTAWPRCYNPKPARAVELEAELAPIIQQKFHLDTAYCDVHTAVRPWDYCDFDARVPGAGTFAATLFAYGEIMLHQKRTWNGPVYSEGNNHWYYCGLTDGNYAQDQAARLAERPWLVDFDLRKLHPLCCNFGMGNLGMFYGRGQGLGSTAGQREARLDRFLAATLAFGHTGFLVLEGGMENAVRSYFNLQQVHARYARQTVTDVHYADQDGNLLDSSAAVAGGAYRRSQVVVRYADGLKVAVNGHPTETWRTPDAELPPNGWFVSDIRGGKLIAWSKLADGHRADYVDSPAYLYADGRGRLTRFDKAACDGQMIAHLRDDGAVEVIPVGSCSSFGVSLDGRSATVVALDEEGQSVGPAETRLSRGLVYVTPVAKAFSYLLKPGPAAAPVLKCDRQKVVPGERVQVTGKTPHSFRVPADTPPGTRLWRQFDGAWIDFTVVPLVDARLRVDEAFHLELTSHLAAGTQAEVSLAGQSQTVTLAPETPLSLQFPLARPKGEEVRAVPMKMVAGQLAHQQTWWLKAEESITSVAAVPEQFEARQCVRGAAEKELDQHSGAQAVRREATCGDVTKRCLFMHPPYKTGVGYSSARFEAVELPAEPKAAFRCQIGKGNGSDPGDGILFRIVVVAPDGSETTVAEKQWIKHAWTPLQADLSPWAGRRVRIKLIADVGPADNSSGDWACWAGMRIESTEPVLGLSVHDQPVKVSKP